MPKRPYAIIVCLLAYLLLEAGVVAQENGPFYANEGDVTYTKIFSFDYEKVSHTVQLGTDESGNPIHYYARLRTPVCEDSICEILNLEMYWDLLGNYIAFDTIPGYPLTKYDHVKFTVDEYQELHKILQDNNSALKELQMSDLVNNGKKLESESIDAASGATSVYVADAVVKGGV